MFVNVDVIFRANILRFGLIKHVLMLNGLRQISQANKAISVLHIYKLIINSHNLPNLGRDDLMFKTCIIQFLAA